MATTVTESIVVRRSVDEVAAEVTNPEVVLPVMGGFGRFRKLGELEWDLYLDVGSIHVGGRVLLEPGETSLGWQSVRGTVHRALIAVTPAEDGHSRVTMTLTLEFAGLVTGRLAELLARGIARRHLQAGLQQLRHHVEFGE